MRDINKIIVHCTATPEGRNDKLADIDRMHRERKFNKIGYHYLIELDGAIRVGRKEDEVGAHASGYNTNSIGVCYVGGMTTDMKEAKDTRTEAQKQALTTILKQLRVKYPQAKIIGHRDVANKACPSFNPIKEYKSI